VAERFDLDVHWEGILKTVYISAPQYIANNGRPYENLEPVIDYNDDELDLFERVVFAECRDEPYIGYVAVAAVIINRVQSPDWPDTLRGVMMQPGQFQVVANGTYKWKANDWAKKAVREALVGADPSQNALFFFNPQRSTVRAMFKRPITTVIGGHRFTR
jgi:N-acetylmuramoyl-L-alanine amidase